jgi:hypothetical protein
VQILLDSRSGENFGKIGSAGRSETAYSNNKSAN